MLSLRSLGFAREWSAALTPLQIPAHLVLSGRCKGVVLLSSLQVTSFCFHWSMRSLRRQLGVVAVRPVYPAMSLPLSHGGGEPPPTPPMATRPPPEPPPVPSGRIFRFQIGTTRTLTHPPSTASRFSSSILSALHFPRLPYFFSIPYTPPESPFPSGSVCPLFPKYQGLRSELPSLSFHSLLSDLPATINVCGAGENKHDLWDGVCDVRASTLLFRPKKVKTEGDVQIDPIYRALAVIEFASNGIVTAELREERCSKWKLSPAN